MLLKFFFEQYSLSVLRAAVNVHIEERKIESEPFKERAGFLNYVSLVFLKMFSNSDYFFLYIYAFQSNYTNHMRKGKFYISHYVDETTKA